MPVQVRHTGPNGVLEVVMTDGVDIEEIRKLLPVIADATRSHNETRLFVEVQAMPAAAWDESRDDLARLSHVARLAVVSDKKLQGWAASFCRPFTTATTRCFEPHQARQALAWLTDERELDTPRPGRKD